MKDAPPKKVSNKPRKVIMKPECDCTGGISDKYVDRYKAGLNVVQIDPELAELFPDSKSVSDALRQMVLIA